MTMDNDPILAIATASGVGGIGIIRMSFSPKLVPDVVAALFGPTFQPRTRYAHLKTFMDMHGNRLDELIVLYFEAPHSYTGEAVIELQAHGGPVLMRMLQKTCLEKCAHLGFRLAEPGEFTKRAFLNNRLDLAQAEAVSDVIHAMSESAVQAAQRSLSGQFSQHIRALNDQLQYLRAYVEATLDFPEEEVEHLDEGQIFHRLAKLDEELQAVFRHARQGQIMRDGVTVAIVGSPNVGKSSLLNALAGDEVAIVTDIPGTTRDKIEQWITIDGMPVKVVDTAGIRDTEDVVEKKGIERALAELAKAQVVLHLKDASGAIEDDPAQFARLLKATPEHAKVIEVQNKIDKGQVLSTSPEAVCVSALTGEGLAELREALKKAVGLKATTDGLFMARERHLLALETASRHVCEARSLARLETLDLFAEELRLANESLSQILGEYVADDLLGLIFTQFCIGK